MSVAWDNVEDEPEDVTGDASPTKQENDSEASFELIEFFCEVYVTVGVAAPCFLAIMGIILQVIGDSSGGQLVLMGLPALTFLTTTGLVIGIQRTISGTEITEQFTDEMRLYEVSIIASLFVILFVFTLIHQTFLSQISELDVSVVTEPYLLLTVVAISLPSGYLLGYLERQSSGIGILMSVLTTAIIGIIYWFIAFL